MFIPQKVKVFKFFSPSDAEKTLNEFLSDKDVIDIKVNAVECQARPVTLLVYTVIYR